jgi:hypothetical protein
MRRRHLALVALVFVTTGCYQQRIESLEQRVTALETEHAATRAKLQALLQWINHKDPPDVGLYDWMKAVNAKISACKCGGGATDPILPSAPPPPF